MTKNLVLSLYPGIDGLGLGFRRAGYCVVRGPDLIYGQDMTGFNGVPGAFEGIIAGPPCQDFSTLNRNPGDNSHIQLEKTVSVIERCGPQWWLIENVDGVPTVSVEGYDTQRFTLDLAWFSDYGRRRVFQFGDKSGRTLNPIYERRGEVKRNALTCNEDIGVEMMRDIQGFPPDHKLPAFTRGAKKRAYGNSVPVQLSEYVAGLIREVPVQKTLFDVRKQCLCNCGRTVMGRQKYASGTCRSRAFRNRHSRSSIVKADGAGV